MFNKFKQKIADGVEGVSAGRQTPLRATKKVDKNNENEEVWPQRSKRPSLEPENSPNINFEPPFGDNQSSGKHKSSPQEVLARVHHLLEVGRAQAQNNGRIEDNLDCSSEVSQLQPDSFNHPLDENYMTSTPLEVSQDDEPPHPPSSVEQQQSYTPQPLHSVNQPAQRSNSRQRRSSNSSNRSNSSAQDERAHTDSDMEASVRTDNMSVNELRELYRKQDRSLRRYKQKFSELVDAYKGLQKDKEKLEGTLTNGQDKQLRRIKELKETIELEQDSKRHLEESLRMELGEKDDKIDVLKTQVGLLKNKYGLSSPAKGSSSVTGSDADTDIIQGLQDKVQLLNAEIEKLTTDNDQAHALVLRSEQEKKTAIEGVMDNMHELLNEQEDLRSEVNILREELKNRDITILNMREKEADLEEKLKNEIMDEMRETVLVEGLKQQEAELQTVFEEKESQLKNLFADKVHDLQRVMEENEKQKLISLQQKTSDITRKNDEILVLNEQLHEWTDKESKLKSKIQKITSEKEASDKRYSDVQQQTEQEKAKRTELIAQHTKQQKEKQDEFNEQIAKIKRTSQTKVYEAQDQLRKKTNELNETVERHKVELDAKVKESTQFMQSEHAKASRKLEIKISDMKKMIKELRQKLSEREGKCNELESTILDAKTEVDQAKSLNTSLVESEEKVGQLSFDMEVMIEEVEEWKKKYEILHNSYTEVSEELEEEKKNCLEVMNDRDKISQEMQTMMENVKEEEGALQDELNNLKTKFSFVEEGSKELTQQLHNKVSEIELLVKTLDGVNKELNMKDSIFASKCKENDELKEIYNAKCKEIVELKEIYNATLEEKQQMEYKHDEHICELEESKSEVESKLKSEYELKLQTKDEELKNQLKKFLNDKDYSVEVATMKLEEMHRQELVEMESRYELQLNELHNDLKSKIDDVEMKHVKRNEQEKDKLISEKDAIIQKLEIYLLSIKDDEKCTEELGRKEIELRTQIDEINLKHKQDIEKLESRYNEQIRNINEANEKDLNNYKTQMESFDKQKCNDLNEISKKHTEDKAILLEQIEELSFNLDEMKLICEQKDKEYALLAEKQENELAVLSESSKLSNNLQIKLEEQEIIWKETHQDLEKKFKKIINDRDKMNKSSVEEIELKHSEKIKSLQDVLSSKETEFASQLQESDNQINLLKQKIEECNIRLKENNERYESEISGLKSRESDAWSQLEHCKAESSNLKERYESEIAILHAKSLEDKSMVEELNVKLMSGESNSKEIDTKFSQLLIEKSKLEQKRANDQYVFEDKIRHLEDEKDNLKSSYEENIRKLEDRVIEGEKCFEKQKCELLNKQSENEESNSTKLLDLKKRAEMKISKLKKENNEKMCDFESTKTELLEKITLLEIHLEEEQLKHEKEMKESKECYFQDFESTLKSNSEKFGAEILTLKDALLIKSEKIIQLEEQLDNATVDKMDTLKTLKHNLEDEHAGMIKKIQDDYQKQIDIVERKVTARVDEKEFEHGSQVKAMLKQFQIDMCAKDMEIQSSVQEAIECAQKDEKKIICEYEEQIAEYIRELHLREQDMLALQQETQQQLDLLNGEREAAEKEHRESFEKLEIEYHQRLEDLSKRHEETLLNIAQKNTNSMNEAEVNMNKHLNEMEEKYALQIQELEDNHKNDIQAQEKKYKSQLKQAKLEIRKLLAGRGANIPNGGDHDLNSGIASNTSSDSEMDQSEVAKLKEKVATMSKELASLREREKCLAMQAEQAPSTPKRNDRPATLQLNENLNDSVSSPPKSPQPLEFEYLRNILYNYMMGKQRRQMAKVLTAIVHFSPTQVRQILAKVEEQEATVAPGGYFKWT